tara:strand:+ start:2798 stop:3442 length:645 start_codon:yes stop_codon:yes gene_type:complete
MSIQNIVNKATFLTVDKRKVSAQTITRSGRVRTAEVASAVPYRFAFGVTSGYKYSENRSNLEELDRLDITIEEEINIGTSNTGLNYITAYQGDSTGIGSITITGSSAATLILNCTNAGSGTFLFKKGDFIQPASGYRYPFQVTADVAHTTSASLSVPIHRPYIEQSGYSLNGKSLKVGTAVSWFVKMVNKPSYTILPHDRLQIDADIEVVEIIL